ncbi:GntR family transcriptional regulator [Rhodococcus sp. EPR-157]|uniref:GntR family transcriptional regulator n=1 Tax=Rhodococcus sp. EPR-157 TaxID=1813677 RepID=UPI0007BBF1AA|nr:GntR family transcriptional regulator [Rhodococcus sp. EPR-157]KZF06893.1 GntR family transcriptional regulator [Rhodococcus sp. EPR-157]
MNVLNTVSTRDALVDELRTLILSGELEPGTPLTETGLSEKFGVARPTVRSALQVLTARHLAVQSEGRSLIVPDLDISDVRDLYFVRLPLELECVSAIVARNLSLDEAHAQLSVMEQLPDNADWGRRVEAHTAFHVAIVDAVGSPRLSRVYSTLQDEIQLCLAQIKDSYPQRQELAIEHRALLDDLRSGDPDRARAQMRAHLAGAVTNFIRHSAS